MTACHICGYARPAVLDFRTATVSSDASRTFGPVRYLRCPECQVLQTEVTQEWRDNCAAIYANYQDGPETAPLKRRFTSMLDLLGNLPATGRLLELGCGPGHFLMRFHNFRSQWRLAGAEVTDKWRETVLAIPGVEGFFSEGVYQGGGYDLIVMAGLLEHLPDPVSALRNAAMALSPEGRILIAVPNYLQNQADLVIYDHCTHFDPDSMATVARRAGFDVNNGPHGREIIAILTPAMPEFAALAATTDAARKAQPDGILGSTIAARWLLAELDGAPTFFVDEDSVRVGGTLAGLPILSPEQVQPGATVFIPLSRAAADAIIARWKHLPIEWKTA